LQKIISTNLLRVGVSLSNFRFFFAGDFAFVGALLLFLVLGFFGEMIAP